MEPELCAMHVVYVSVLGIVVNDAAKYMTDYAKLTRKMGGKQAMTSSNLRPKSLDQGSPPA
ncbi:hypothetical protein DM02DRAFT_610838 [Periconia macrospinosa]|uniref:Uncharacterized protein n=1 Tax=Periconia macrospinosa TaxID=97972 RepID=A0A2V1E3X3_9PLEO|nr:hypothetical protein DM02DRAFT_610838 [Periconia macrospinosa]